MAEDAVKLEVVDNSFKFVRTELEDEFFIITPDGEETDYVEADGMAVIEYAGSTYFATDAEDYAGMEPGCVYSIGGKVATVEEVEEDDGGVTEDEDADGGEPDEEDEPEV